MMDELVKVSNLAAKKSPDTICPCPGTNMKYSKTPFYEHPLDTDISLLRTFCFIPREKKAQTFSLNSTPLNADTFHGPLSARIIKQGVTVILDVSHLTYNRYRRVLC